jgi:hypothetical protein
LTLLYLFIAFLNRTQSSIAGWALLMLKLFVLRLLRRDGAETMEKSGVHLLEMHSHIHNMSLVLDHRRKDMFFSFSIFFCSDFLHSAM